jgi:hypothetical protein
MWMLKMRIRDVHLIPSSARTLSRRKHLIFALANLLNCVQAAAGFAARNEAGKMVFGCEICLWCGGSCCFGRNTFL